MDIDTIRLQGVGELLGRVIESEALETLVLSGGLATMLALSELALILGLLHWGIAPLLQSVALGTWLVLLGVIVYVYGQRWQCWTILRQSLTGTLVERMTGHRTRLAQQAPVHWHTDEDVELEQYLRLSENLDCASVWLTALLPRGWLVVSVLTLVPAYMAAVIEPVRLAVSLGCLLLGYQALRRAALGITQLVGATIAWQQVAPLFYAAAHCPAGSVLPDTASPKTAPIVLEAHNLVFQYPGCTAPVLRECSLTIRRSEAILLEGNSGSGKSTLVSILSGLRCPASGVLLAGGLDRATLGEREWRRRVVVAPQYHDNHIFAAPLAFNLLFGRRWPPTPEDLHDAEVMCHELGLGELVDRMPSGLMQMVGDTGWQLSQGERSRVFIARGLLQDGALLLLDESFAALDPLNLQRCLECALRHASTLLVVAHP
jgi:ATP-binding cassette subfamily B protein